jgi:hypothetical protein
MKKTTMIENPAIQWDVEKAGEKTAGILLGFDRLRNNPDQKLLKEKIIEQLSQDGFITLTIFSCLDWLPEDLSSRNPESFIGDRVRNGDLFLPRMAKIEKIQSALSQEGIVSKLLIVVGDTDVEEYFKLVLDAGKIFLNPEILKKRTAKYIESFRELAQTSLPTNTEVVKWSEVKDLYNMDVDVPKSLVTQEVESMKQSYLYGKNFSSLNLTVSDDTFTEAAKRKIAMYANQGMMVRDMTKGILLQTETPWLLRTGLLKLSTPEIAVIYPWIRREEIDTT